MAIKLSPELMKEAAAPDLTRKVQDQVAEATQRTEKAAKRVATTPKARRSSSPLDGSRTHHRRASVPARQPALKITASLSQSQPQTAAVENTRVPTQKIKPFFIEVYNSLTKETDTFKITPDAHENITPETAKEYFEACMNHIGKVAPERLPKKTGHITCSPEQTTLKDDKTGPFIIRNEELDGACALYYQGKQSELKEVLEKIKITSSGSDLPDLFFEAPLAFEHGPNTCYLHVALQTLLKSPVSLRALFNARIDDKEPKAKEKREALLALQRFVHVVCRNCKKKNEEVPEKELETLRKALASIDNHTPLAQDEEGTRAQSASEILDLIAGLISNSNDATTIRTERTLKSGVSHGNDDKHYGHFPVALPASGETSDRELLSAYFAKKPHSKDDKIRPSSGGAPEQVEAVNTKIGKHTDQVRLTHERTNKSGQKIPTKVLVGFDLTLPGEISDDGKEGVYSLSTVIFHDGETPDGEKNHFRVIVRQLKTDGKFHNYLCDDLGPKIQELDDEACKTYLKDHAHEVCESSYTKTSYLKEALAKRQKKQAAEPGATPTSETRDINSPATPSGPITRELLAEEGGINPVKVYKDDINRQSADTSIVNFTNEELDTGTVAIDDTIRECARRVLGSKSLSPNQWYSPFNTAITSEGKQIVHVNPGTSESQLRTATQKALDKVKAADKIAIPLAQNTGFTDQEVYAIILEEAASFAKEHSQTQISIILTPDQQNRLNIKPQPVANKTLTKPAPVSEPTVESNKITEIIHKTTIHPVGKRAGAAASVASMASDAFAAAVENKFGWKQGIVFSMVEHSAAPKEEPKASELLPSYFLFSEERAKNVLEDHTFTSPFNRAMEAAKKDSRKDVVIYVHKEENNINREANTTAYTDLIKQLGSQSDFKAEDGDFRSIQVVVLPAVTPPPPVMINPTLVAEPPKPVPVMTNPSRETP